MTSYSPTRLFRFSLRGIIISVPSYRTPNITVEATGAFKVRQDPYLVIESLAVLALLTILNMVNAMFVII